MNTQIDFSDFDELSFSSEYADYIMSHSTRSVGNGDMLLELQEDFYLFDEFLEEILPQAKQYFSDCYKDVMGFRPGSVPDSVEEICSEVKILLNILKHQQKDESWV